MKGFLHGLRLWRLTRYSNGIAVNATHWAYFTNHTYVGEKRYYIRLGARPGWVRSFGKVRT